MAANKTYIILFSTMCFVLLYSLQGYYFMLNSKIHYRHQFEYFVTKLNVMGERIHSFNYSNIVWNSSIKNNVNASSYPSSSVNTVRNGSSKDVGGDSVSGANNTRKAIPANTVTARTRSVTIALANQHSGSSVDNGREDDVNNDKTPLLVLFSSWPDNMDSRVRNNTCYNWGSLRPQVLPVLFSNSSAAAEECRKHGWVILPLTPTAAGGAPILKFMFIEVLKRFNAALYGFSNGDILYGDDLLKTLSVVCNKFPLVTPPLLVVGIRTNVVNVTSEEASSFESLREVAKNRGKLFISVAQDYFITNRAFPWSEIPEVVVGRVAYDNWLVLDSIHNHYTVIDATSTILAIHQTTHKGNYQGRSNPNDPKYNSKLLAKHHKRIFYNSGSTQCIPAMTKYSETGQVVTLNRSNVPPYCKKAYG